MKLLWLLVLAVLAVRLVTGRWPWQLLGGARPRRAAKARILLGVPDGASREAIIEAHRKLVVQVHPDRGGTNEQVHEANAARDVLLDELAVKSRQG